jgi:hypothetical protein
MPRHRLKRNLPAHCSHCRFKRTQLAFDHIWSEAAPRHRRTLLFKLTRKSPLSGFGPI